MLKVDLRIQTDNNKFIITVDKEEITPEYLIELINWLQIQSKMFSENKSKAKKNNKRVWNYTCSTNLNKKIDDMNIRDLAYE